MSHWRLKGQYSALKRHPLGEENFNRWGSHDGGLRPERMHWIVFSAYETLLTTWLGTLRVARALCTSIPDYLTRVDVVMKASGLSTDPELASRCSQRYWMSTEEMCCLTTCVGLSTS